jgi:CheY-like chemotaxis protein
MKKVIVALNRRWTQRRNLAVRLRFRVMNSSVPEQRAESVNISKGGVYFTTELTLEQGAPIQLLMKMPQEITGKPTTEWRCTGHVVRVTPVRSPRVAVGIGVRFDCYEILPGFGARDDNSGPIPFPRIRKMQLQNATILLVDDEPDLRAIVADWFGRKASRVLLARNGAEALNIIHANQVDAVVSDVRMPVMDGITLLRTLKATDSYKPCVVFGGGFTDIEAREAYDLGVEATMPKPVERKHLIAVLTRIFTERDELWRLPPLDKAEAVLDATFGSLATARSQGLLTFGRGGFCIHSTLKLREGPVELLLDFEADKRRVTGQGIVRWTASSEAQVGVEITYIDDESRDWILNLTRPNKSLSFIPRTTAIQTTPGMRACM